MLIKDYYIITERTRREDSEVFCITLNPSCAVYEGHFPDMPVSPGVCNIQMLLECAELVAGKPLRISSINRCRLTTLITPETHPRLEAHITLTDNTDHLLLNASLGMGDDVYMLLSARLLPIDE